MIHHPDIKQTIDDQVAQELPASYVFAVCVDLILSLFGRMTSIPCGAGWILDNIEVGDASFGIVQKW